MEKVAREYLLSCGEVEGSVVVSPEPVTLVYNVTLEAAVGRQPFCDLFEALREIPMATTDRDTGNLFFFSSTTSFVQPSLFAQIFSDGRQAEAVTARLIRKAEDLTDIETPDPYEGGPSPSPITSDVDTWLDDLQMFLSEGTAAMGYRDTFFRKTVLPMARAYEALSRKDKERAIIEVKSIRRPDWRTACEHWLNVC